MNPNYRIRYKKKDFELEVEGDRDFVLQQFHTLIGFNSDNSDVTININEISSPEISGSLTLVEFYKSKKPKTHDDRFVLFAYWHTLKEGKDTFKVEDIVAFYTKVSEKRPSNPAQHMTNNVKRAYFQRVSDGVYKLTTSGSQFVSSLSGSDE